MGRHEARGRCSRVGEAELSQEQHERPIRRLPRLAAAAALTALAVSLTTTGAPRAESADCTRLRQEIDAATRSGQGAQYEAAAQRQRGEIDRLTDYARSIGCENHKFLIFGSDPPAQCGSISSQIARMRANLDDLQSRAGGGSGGRGELLARYRDECGGGGQQNQGTVFDALFNTKPQTDDVTVTPLNPDDTMKETVIEQDTGAHAGSKAVCVKTCDGSFFPVSYTASSGRLGALEDLCRAQCPNAEVTLFTYPSSGDIDEAVSSAGVRYMDSPNALKYRTSYDPNCSCRRRGQTWADALAAAETKLGHETKSDIIVTAEKSVELSRPKADPKAKGPTPAPSATPSPVASATPGGVKPAPGTDAEGVDTVLSQETATVSRETSGIAAGDAQSGAYVGAEQGQTAEVIGPDGVKRRVRIIDPTL